MLFIALRNCLPNAVLGPSPLGSQMRLQRRIHECLCLCVSVPNPNYTPTGRNTPSSSSSNAPHYMQSRGNATLNRLLVLVHGADVATKQPKRRVEPPDYLPVETSPTPVKLACLGTRHLVADHGAAEPFE